MKNFGIFVLKSLAVVLATIGVLFISGIATIKFNNENHNSEYYVDGVLVEAKEWQELNNVVAGIDLQININKDATLWQK